MQRPMVIDLLQPDDIGVQFPQDGRDARRIVASIDPDAAMNVVGGDAKRLPDHPAGLPAGRRSTQALVAQATKAMIAAATRSSQILSRLGRRSRFSN